MLPLEKYLAEIFDSSKPLTVSKLTNLSDLSAEELQLFQRGWAGVAEEQRYEIVSRLVELTEDNFDLSFDDIFQGCLDDPSELVRAKAIEGLKGSEDCRLVIPLVKLLLQDETETVRVAAAVTLGRFALLSEFEKLRPYYATRVCDALLAVVENKGESLELRRRALEAISPLSLPRIKQLIEEAYASDNPKLRASAIYAMGRSCNPVWLPTLIGELSNPDAEIRFEAVGACAELDDEVVPHLIPLCYDRDSEVQVAAIVALGQVGGKQARQALQRLLDDTDDLVRRTAERALAETELDRVAREED